MKLLLVVLAVAAASPAMAQKAPECGAFPADQSEYLCLCGEGPHVGIVWGNGPYTGDSDVCAAAVHAGEIGPAGGRVLALRVEGVGSHTGTSANGVLSQSWGAYPTSFTFPLRDAVGEQTCRGLRDGESALSCGCPPEGQWTRGAVWGSGPYTADSDVCSAAIHSGVIGPEGGSITVLAGPGQPSYPASTANGIETSAWGEYDASVAIAAPAE